MNETYIVTEQRGRIGQMENSLVTSDADEAKQFSDERRKTINEQFDTGETFIEVWEDGELQFVTRDHPNNVR